MYNFLESRCFKFGSAMGYIYTAVIAAGCFFINITAASDGSAFLYFILLLLSLALIGSFCTFCGIAGIVLFIIDFIIDVLKNKTPKHPGTQIETSSRKSRFFKVINIAAFSIYTAVSIAAIAAAGLLFP